MIGYLTPPHVRPADAHHRVVDPTEVLAAAETYGRARADEARALDDGIGLVEATERRERAHSRLRLILGL